MEIIRVKMTTTFKCQYKGCYGYFVKLDKGKEYYAMHAGDYWAVQGSEGRPFTIVIPETSAEIVLAK